MKASSARRAPSRRLASTTAPARAASVHRVPLSSCPWRPRGYRACATNSPCWSRPAYLNAGTDGPLPAAAPSGSRGAARRGCARTGRRALRAPPRARRTAARGIRARARVRPERGGAHNVHQRGARKRDRRPGLERGRGDPHKRRGASGPARRARGGTRATRASVRMAPFAEIAEAVGAHDGWWRART